MKLFIGFIRVKRLPLLTFALFFLTYFVTFALFRLPVSAVLYPTVLCLAVGLAILLYGYARYLKVHRALENIMTQTVEMIDSLPESISPADEDYRAIIRNLCEYSAKQADVFNRKYNDMVDYYTVWAHQIKTPIASMRINLQNADKASPGEQVSPRRLMNDLNRIERYVDMVLTFLRLDSTGTDYVIEEYSLDPIIKPVVRKFAGDFIAKKLSLVYEPIEKKVLTDEKWLSFVIEQLVSNAVKYTAEGSVTIRLEEPDILCIEDTGIGIAPEDIPRVFENGYTGFNGRTDKRASGIGLYLCKRICDKLGHGIRLESGVGKGTIVRIYLASRRLEVE